MSIPNMQWVIDDARAKYPRAWEHCHREGDPEAMDFIILAAREMSVHDNTVNVYGMNGKRGNMSDPSLDVIYVVDNGGTDGVFDVVVGAGSSGASSAWNYIGPGENSTSGYIDPWAWNTHFDYSGAGSETNPPVEPPKPVYPPYEAGFGGDKTGQQFTTLLEADYKRAGRPGLDATSGTWAWRTMYDAGDAIVTKGAAPNDAMKESVDKHRPEWCAELGIPVV